MKLVRRLVMFGVSHARTARNIRGRVCPILEDGKAKTRRGPLHGQSAVRGCIDLLLEPAIAAKCHSNCLQVPLLSAYRTPPRLWVARFSGSADQWDWYLPRSGGIVQYVAPHGSPCRSGGVCLFQGKFDGKGHSAIRISASPNLTAVLRDDAICN